MWRTIVFTEGLVNLRLAVLFIISFVVVFGVVQILRNRQGS